MVNKLQMTEKQVAMWQQKLDNLENRMRQNNIIIPERAEGQNAEDFLERWLKVTIPDAEFSCAFTVGRAHIVPQNHRNPMLPQGHSLYTYRTVKTMISFLRKTRQKGIIQYEN